MTVRIVTDSTSDIDAELARELNITIVPLTVLFGHETFLDRVDITPDEFYRRLESGDVLPTTTQPSPGVFADVYRRLLSQGDEILVLVLSGKLSGTFQSAANAASMVGGERLIEVIDSRSTAMGLGLLSINAAQMAAKNQNLATIAAAIRNKIPNSHIVMLFDTLRYLAKGGRIGKAQGLVGSILQVKPVLTVKDGEVSPLARLRSVAAGTEYLYNFATGFHDIEEIAVEHATTPETADILSARLKAVFPNKKIYRSQVSPVLGTYMGPNVLSVSILSRNKT